MGRDIDVIDEEMIAASISVFVGGLHPVENAKSLRAHNPVVRYSSRTGRTWRPRST